MKRFYRSEDGVIAGVCRGLAESLEVDVGLLRLGFVFSVLFLGCGLLAYIGLAIALPRKDRMDQAMEPVLLGVCSVLSRKFELDVSIVRFLAILSPFWSLGGSVIVYIILKLVLSEPSAQNQEVRDLN